MEKKWRYGMLTGSGLGRYEHRFPEPQGINRAPSRGASVGKAKDQTTFFLLSFA